MGLTPTLFEGLLKKFYTPRKLQSMLFKDFPILDLVNRLSNCGGSSFVLPVMNGANTKRSADYATAYNNASNTVAAKFDIPWVQDYCISEIDGKVFEESNTSVGAFVKAFQQQTEASTRALSKSYAIKLYRDGSGAVAQMNNSTTSTSIITLASPTDAYNFEIGDIVQGATTATGALLNSSATAAVVAINPGAVTSTITLDGTWGSKMGASSSITDFIFPKGDAQNNATTPGVIAGLLGWSPATTNALTVSFFGVVRSTDQRRLAGLYVPNTTALPIDEQLQTAVQLLVANGGKPKAILLNPVDHLALVKVAGNKVMRQQGGTAKIGFQAVDFITSNGTLPTYPDPACPSGKGFVVDTDGLVLASMGEIIKPMKQGDASVMQKKPGEDAYYVAWGGYPAFMVERPGQQVATVEL